MNPHIRLPQGESRHLDSPGGPCCPGLWDVRGSQVSSISRWPWEAEGGMEKEDERGEDLMSLSGGMGEEGVMGHLGGPGSN